MPVSQAARPKSSPLRRLAQPRPKAHRLQRPCPCSPLRRAGGIEMMAPSGKFWMAMPRDRASALAAVICALPARKPAYITPICHALRDVVQGHCQHHHRSAAQPAFWPLSLLTADMQVGYQMIQSKQKQHAEPKSGKRREKRRTVPTSPTVRLPGSAGSRPMPPPSHRRQSLQVSAALGSPRARRIKKIRMLRPAMYPKGNQNPPKKFPSMKSPPFMVYTQKHRYFIPPCSMMLLTSCAHL